MVIPRAQRFSGAAEGQIPFQLIPFWDKWGKNGKKRSDFAIGFPRWRQLRRGTNRASKTDLQGGSSLRRRQMRMT